ncbi:hypothetical protein [uncultured Oceanicoccus sp.]
MPESLGGINNPKVKNHTNLLQKEAFKIGNKSGFLVLNGPNNSQVG